MSTPTLKDWDVVENVRSNSEPIVTLRAARGKGVCNFNAAAVDVLGIKPGERYLVCRSSAGGMTIGLLRNDEGVKVYGKGGTAGLSMSGGAFSTALGNAYSRVRWHPTKAPKDSEMTFILKLKDSQKRP